MRYTNRSDFPAILPTVHTEYCWGCHALSPAVRQTDHGKEFSCSSCGQVYPRALMYDPNTVMEFDDQGRIVHEGSGVFALRPDGKLLLFQRTKFPFLLTIPAGHINTGEDPLECAAREMEEEVGVRPEGLKLIYEQPILGDSCVGGADIHLWHAYVARLSEEQSQAIALTEEGSAWSWYDLDALNAENTVQPVMHMLADASVSAALYS